jgi:hypothetical protein
MKRSKVGLSLAIWLMSMISFLNASAQVSYGLKLTAGQQFVFFRIIDTKVNTYTGVGIGGTLRIPLTKKMHLLTEVNYFTPVSSSFKENTLSLPLLLTYKISPVIEVEAGPSLERDFSFVYSNADIDKNHHPDVNLGANAGLNIWPEKKWSANIRYSVEVFRTRYSFWTHPIDYPFIIPEPSFRHALLTASLRYKLGKA